MTKAGRAGKERLDLPGEARISAEGNDRRFIGQVEKRAAVTVFQFAWIIAPSRWLTATGGAGLLYHWFEMGRAAAGPARAAADSARWIFGNPFNPLSYTPLGTHAAAACEVFERSTRRYEKPGFELSSTVSEQGNTDVSTQVVWERPFCKLLHFKRDVNVDLAQPQPKILLVAPMSGHFATLLRGTVDALLPNHEVFITDWQDACRVGTGAGRFDLDDYIDYLIGMFEFFEGDVHVFAVCQPAVPALAATALMEAAGNDSVPHSLILAGGPVDTRISPTQVNAVAVDRGTDWFHRHVITTVPWPLSGAGRRVYPGFLQLAGFMSMNLDRHVKAHHDMFSHLVDGDGDSAQKHREFYDEYLAVMDLTAEFFLQTIDSVFVRHLLPKGEMVHRGQRVDLGAIKRVALMSIEGGKDDITGVGQCRAALDLTPGIPERNKYHYEASGVGHYGIFNGSRFLSDIAPRISQFALTHDPRAAHYGAQPAVGPAKASGITGSNPGNPDNPTDTLPQPFSFRQPRPRAGTGTARSKRLSRVRH